MWSSQPLPAKELELKKFLLLLFSGSVMSDSLWPHRLQHTRLPGPSLSPPACSNSSPLCWWGYLIISPSAVTFSFYLSYFPLSGSISMSRLLASGGQKKFYCRGGGWIRSWEVGWSEGTERVGDGRFIICNALEGTVEGALSLGIGL